MQIVSNDNTVRKDKLQGLKDFILQSVVKGAKKGKQLVSMTPAIKKAFDLLGDDIVELSSEKELLKNKIGTYDEKRLEESKAKLLKQTIDEKKANLIMSRMDKRIKKQY